MFFVLPCVDNYCKVDLRTVCKYWSWLLARSLPDGISACAHLLKDKSRSGSWQSDIHFFFAHSSMLQHTSEQQPTRRWWWWWWKWVDVGMGWGCSRRMIKRKLLIEFLIWITPRQRERESWSQRWNLVQVALHTRTMSTLIILSFSSSLSHQPLTCRLKKYSRRTRWQCR